MSRESIAPEPKRPVFPGFPDFRANVTFVPIQASYSYSTNTTGCPAGHVGTYSFNATLTNRGTNSLGDLFVKVSALSNGNLLQNANDGPAGVGAELTVPKANGYSDGLLSPGEAVIVPFSLCLKTKTSFSFYVDVWGIVH